MLELARLIVDADWMPPRPIIFLFNGAEELFLLVSDSYISPSMNSQSGSLLDLYLLSYFNIKSLSNTISL